MPNTIELYANNARTTLAGSANNTVTSLVLQSGAGALFPSPNNTIGEYAKATLQDSATGLRNEIVYITARTGDVLTVIRGQDGSTAQTWSAGDTVFEGVTAATLASFVQPSKLQSGEYVYADATGTTSAYIATLTPAIATVNAGLVVRVNTNSVGTNTTTTPTLNVNGLGAFTIVKQGGALIVGDMPKLAQLQYDSTLTQWVLLNPVNPGRLLNVQSFLTAGVFTYTATVGTKSIIIELVGAGGGVPSTTTVPTSWTGVCCPSGSGSYIKSRYTSDFDGLTLTIGAGGVIANGTGGTGGTSSFGTLATCYGGTGGRSGFGSTYPFNTAGASDTSAPLGGNISSYTGKGGTQALVVGAAYGNGITDAQPSAFQGDNGSGKAGFFVTAGSAAAGRVGNAGGAIIWEYS